jgi:hypothetical protein
MTFSLSQILNGRFLGMNSRVRMSLAGRTRTVRPQEAGPRLPSPDSTPCGQSSTAAIRNPGQVFCFANASRASCSCFQFGAYFSASSYFASASLGLLCFTSTSPHDLSGSAQCGPR